MAVQAQSRVAPRRLNPFAFPSDTDFRFTLLITTVLASSIFIYGTLYFLLAINARRFFFDTFLSQLTGNPASIIPDQIGNIAWIMLSLVLLLSVAGALYWAFPAWKIWRKNSDSPSR